MLVELQDIRERLELYVSLCPTNLSHAVFGSVENVAITLCSVASEHSNLGLVDLSGSSVRARDELILNEDAPLLNNSDAVLLNRAHFDAAKRVEASIHRDACVPPSGMIELGSFFPCIHAHVE